MFEGENMNLTKNKFVKGRESDAKEKKSSGKHLIKKFESINLRWNGIKDTLKVECAVEVGRVD
jgi:hypothetical protein